MTRMSAVGDATVAMPGVVPTPSTVPAILPYSADANITRKLQTGCRIGRKKLATARKMRYTLLKEYVGRHYMGVMDGQSQAQPLNFFFRALWSIVPSIVFNNPETAVRTENLQLRQFAEVFGLALNHLVKRTDLRMTLRHLVVDAVIGPMGIVKQGITFGNQVQIGGELHDVGQPFADRVSFDDYVIDPQAKSREQAWFEGDAYEMPLEYIRGSGLYQNFENLRACDSSGKVKEEAWRLGLGEAKEGEMDDLVPMVKVQDIYIPQEGLLLTIPMEEAQGTLPLRMVEWEGPRQGPYDVLYFHMVPDNVIPLSPGSIWYDLVIMINEEARRLKREASRRKSILAYTPAAADDASRVRDADDGEAVQVQNIEQLKQFDWGGAKDSGYEHMQYLKGMFSYISGNADLTGGLGTPNSDTATEASILQGNAQTVIGDLKSEVNIFAGKLLEKYAWYLWTDPLINLPLARRMPDGAEVQVHFSYDAKQGDFLDYQFEIVANSMSNMDPAVRAKRLQDLAMGWVLPTAQIAAAQGDMPNIREITKALAGDLGLVGVDAWYRSAQPVAPSGAEMIAGQMPTGKGPGDAVPQLNRIGPGNPANPDTPKMTDPAMVNAAAYGKRGNELNNSGGQ